MPPTFCKAEYSGLIAAPGIPKAVSTPSRRITRTAASIALILLIFLVPLAFCNCIQVVFGRSVFTASATGQCILFSSLCVRRKVFVGYFFDIRQVFAKILYTKNNSIVFYLSHPVS